MCRNKYIYITDPADKKLIDSGVSPSLTDKTSLLLVEALRNFSAKPDWRQPLPPLRRGGPHTRLVIYLGNPTAICICVRGWKTYV